MTTGDTELLTGRAGNEAAAGYREMPMANPDPNPEPAIDSDSAIAQHLRRPPPPEPTERKYTDQVSGEDRPSNETVELERASRDISEIRAAERAALERQRNSELNDAISWLEREEAVLKDAATPRPVEQQQAQEPQPPTDYTPQLDPETVQATDPQYDPELLQALSSPKVRAVLEQVNAGVEQTKAQYQAATAELATQAQGVLTALFPELANLSGQALQGALVFMQQSQPERFQQFQQLTGRAQQLVGIYRQQQAEAQAQQQQQYAQQLEWFKVAEDEKWEAAIARDRSPDQIKALRENAMPLIERHYGISPRELGAIYSGQQRVDAATFMRSANFQLMLSDALSYRMSREAVGRAVNRPVPQVIRPGSPAEFQTRTEAALAEAQAKLKPSMSAKEAAAYVIARRAASR